MSKEFIKSTIDAIIATDAQKLGYVFTGLTHTQFGEYLANPDTASLLLFGVVTATLMPYLGEQVAISIRLALETNTSTL